MSSWARLMSAREETRTPPFRPISRQRMQLIDWILVFGSIFIVVAVGVYTQRFMKSVADFLSAGRVARRYLLAVARDEMATGAVIFVAAWEVTGQSGFTLTWWGTLVAPVFLLVAVAGFVIYRYRETRAMTLGQFFEIRYSKRFRLFTGFLGFFAGIVNFGIIPAIGARVMVYFLGMPGELHLGGMTVPTFIPLMGGLLVVNFFVAAAGGLVTIMMTNCVEGILSQIFYLVLIFGLLSMFSWSDISATLTDRPAGQSLLNPFDSSGLKDFNVWYVIMGTAVAIYGTMAWQNQSSYQSAPLNAHEGRMGGLLGRWRGMGKGPVVVLLALCAMTYLHSPHYAAGAAQVHGELAHLSNAQTREQMEIPIAITHLLPPGLRGALCAILLLGIFGGDSTHLHSWGSLFIQDVVLPWRKKPFTPRQHIRLLRLSMAGVALFAFLFGALVDLADYIQMWWSATQSIYVGGAGAAIIGGLYWKKGTTAGAWVGLIAGSVLSCGGIVLQAVYAHEHAHFPLNGVQISFFAMLIAIGLYIAVSLLTCRENFNMDRMLHRGPYARRENLSVPAAPVPRRPKISWATIVGYDEHFTRGDRWIAGGLLTWSFFWVAVVAIISIWNLWQPWPVAAWSKYYQITAIGVPVFFAVMIGIWFTWGSISDSLALFKRLRAEKVNPLDSGAVVNHQNLEEVAAPPEILPTAVETERAQPVK